MMNPTIKYCAGQDSCCSKQHLCGEGEGDCDSDSDCKSGLKCGKQNCAKKSGGFWDANDDCCFKPKGMHTKDLHPKCYKLSPFFH